MQQAITWANDDPVLWHHMASQGHIDDQFCLQLSPDSLILSSLICRYYSTHLC